MKFAIKSWEQLKEFLKTANWQSFEKLVKHILEENGFETKLHFRFGKKKQEIDILAENLVSLAVECKKFGKGYSRKAKLKSAAKKLKEKAAELEKARKKKFIPIVVTVWEEDIKEVDGVYFVPIYALNEFLKSLTP